MFVAGLPLFAWFGILLLSLILLQVLMGRRVLKVDFRLHRVNGYVILSVGLVHAFLALRFLLG
ncbi:MAG: hypothetical protein C4521_10270 [Actinobacteria bacterium]|nr:MAG: hypothetical protein C4521_10270 [Actinomycetota bacterium]